MDGQNGANQTSWDGGQPRESQATKNYLFGNIWQGVREYPRMGKSDQNRAKQTGRFDGQGPERPGERRNQKGDRHLRGCRWARMSPNSQQGARTSPSSQWRDG